MFDGRTILTATGVAIAAAVGLGVVAERDDTGAVTSAGSVDAFEVRVGDCFDDGAFASEDVTEVPAVPCAEAHDNEVFATFDVEGSWPGADSLEMTAYQGCYDRFEAAIGKPYEESILDYTVIYPSEGSWTQLDDREVICVGFHMRFEKLNGSILGSGL